MSYCRFGPESDVYVYEDVSGGWTIHVADAAGLEHPRGEPYPQMDFSSPEAITDSLDAMSRWREEAVRYDRGLEQVKEYYNVPSQVECLDLLLHLRSLGYTVPEHAIERLEEEILEGGKSDE